MAADKLHMVMTAEPAAGDVWDLTDLRAPVPGEHIFSGAAASEDSSALLPLSSKRPWDPLCKPAPSTALV